MRESESQERRFSIKLVLRERGWHDPEMNWLAILCAGVAYFFLGFVWYSLLFGKIWAALGIVLVIIGCLTAIAPRFKDRRRTHADRLPQPVVPPDQTPRVRDPEEEQLY